MFESNYDQFSRLTPIRCVLLLIVSFVLAVVVARIIEVLLWGLALFSAIRVVDTSVDQVSAALDLWFECQGVYWLIMLVVWGVGAFGFVRWKYGLSANSFRMCGNGRFKQLLVMNSLLGVLIQVLLPLIFVSFISILYKEIDKAWVLNLSSWVKAESLFAFQDHVYVGRLLSILVVCPVVEEFIFRGLLYSSFRTKYGVTISIVASSLIFGVYHVNVIMMPSMFVIGAVAASK